MSPNFECYELLQNVSALLEINNKGMIRNVIAQKKLGVNLNHSPLIIVILNSQNSVDD